MITAMLAVAALGVQNDAVDTNQVIQWTDSVGGSWTRVITDLGDESTAQRIRDFHAAGKKVILTVGGTGTHSRHPSFKLALRYIQTLPQAEKYTIANEPDLDGWKPNSYRKQWMKARRVLGSKLLWGDFSPHAPLSFTQRAAASGKLPKNLDVAVHPYQNSDPLAPPILKDERDNEGGMGSLKRGAAWLKKNAGVHVRWWITEFGYNGKQQNLWHRALIRAKQVHAKVLIIYNVEGPTWDTRVRDWDIFS